MEAAAVDSYGFAFIWRNWFLFIAKLNSKTIGNTKGSHLWNPKLCLWLRNDEVKIQSSQSNLVPLLGLSWPAFLLFFVKNVDYICQDWSGLLTLSKNEILITFLMLQSSHLKSSTPNFWKLCLRLVGICWKSLAPFSIISIQNWFGHSALLIHHHPSHNSH